MANYLLFMEEKVGFEPTVPCGTPDFESGTFGHSATSPCLLRLNCSSARQNGLIGQHRRHYGHRFGFSEIPYQPKSLKKDQGMTKSIKLGGFVHGKCGVFVVVTMQTFAEQHDTKPYIISTFIDSTVYFFTVHMAKGVG